MSSNPSAGDGSSINNTEEKLWEWASKQDDVSVNQFATSIIGIGALFFAYGQLHTSHTKLLIALIGLGGSVTLWLNIYGSRKEYYLIKKSLANNPFIIKFNELQRWRRKDVDKFLYHPVSRLMTYFMGLVSWAWIAIILRSLDLVSFQVIIIVSSDCLILALLLVIIRKYRDVAENR